MTQAEHIEEARFAIAKMLGKPPSIIHAEQIALRLAGRVVALEATRNGLETRIDQGTEAWGAYHLGQLESVWSTEKEAEHATGCARKVVVLEVEP